MDSMEGAGLALKSGMKAAPGVDGERTGDGYSPE
jgi:hypothetical protein